MSDSQIVNVLSVNLAAERGRKFQVDEIEFDSKGIIGDVHTGSVRPVSIFAIHHQEKFLELTSGRKPEFGEFAENITVSGLENTDIKVFDRFVSDNCELEVIKVGKPFHDKFRELGNYVMPRVGVFCRVAKPGKLKAGDNLSLKPKVFKILIITLSDRASRGEYEDISGPTVKGWVDKLFKKKNKRYNIETLIIPDDRDKLKVLLEGGKKQYDVIITTGGTGIGPRDFTVDVVEPMLDKERPGIREMIRMKYGVEKPNAYLSRGVAGLMGESLIYTLPGSVKAVNEYMTEITKTLDHLIYMQHGVDTH